MAVLETRYLQAGFHYEARFMTCRSKAADDALPCLPRKPDFQAPKGVPYRRRLKVISQRIVHRSSRSSIQRIPKVSSENPA
jgi:hypothetical protein